MRRVRAAAPSALSEARRLLSERPELAAHVLALAAEPPATCTTSAAGYALVAPLLVGRETEALVCVALSRRRTVIDRAILTEGSDGFTIVDPKQIYRWALTRKRPCSAIILAHNHPSGDPEPSQQDYDVTRRVASAGRILDCLLLDHVVVGGSGYVSLAERGSL